MALISVDIETFSSVPLTKAGSYRYVESPDFEVLLLGYAYDEDPVEVIDLYSGERLPRELERDLFDPRITKGAFNANFERNGLGRHFSRLMEPAQWSCTQMMSFELGLPRSLDKVGEVLGLGADKAKDKGGAALIRFFSIPCKPTKTNGGVTRNLPEQFPEKWAQYVEYNRQDVVAERAVRRKLNRFTIHPNEPKLWALDQAINDRGVQIDTPFVQEAIKIDNIVKGRYLEEAKDLTGLENPKSIPQLKAWMLDETGIYVKSLKKDQIKGVRKEFEDADEEEVLEVLDLRDELNKTSTQKYVAMMRTVTNDSRIRGLSQFYGAMRTGRWAGRLVQMQNLTKNDIPDLDYARNLVAAGDMTTFELLFDVASTLSQLIRTAFVPREGCRFIASDFHAIEACVLAWLAGEQWRLDVFNTHGKIYETSAERMFNLPEGSVDKKTHEGAKIRQKGKISELALGYGGSKGAMIKMGAFDMGLSEGELLPIVKAWRAANPAITKFWWDTDAACRHTIRTKQPSKLPHGIMFYKDGPLLRLRLPSGRDLSYVKPQLIMSEDGRRENITYEGVDQTTGAWGRIETYGPKLVENITQAVARDCLTEAMIRLDDALLDTVFHVHDEAVLEVPFGRSSPEEVAAIMAQPIDWAQGLPLSADAYECMYYQKE